MKPVAVIIPVYQTNLNPGEEISLQQCVRVLGGHPLILVKPAHLSVDGLTNTYPALRVEAFADAYFADIQGYNRLLCSDQFYARFAEYEYILICQLDAFVLRDELLNWCRRGYDYVGAPQFADLRPTPPENRSLREMISPFLQWPLLNGGFSLRRVAACRRLLRVYYRFFRFWPGNEDSFFSLHYPRLLPFRWLMRLPAPKEALAFAVEYNPAQSVILNNNQLPMGGHAWEKYDLDFWRPLLAERGYSV